MKCLNIVGLTALSSTYANAWVHRFSSGITRCFGSPLAGWSLAVEDSDEELSVFEIDETINNDHTGSYDLLSPRGWLEYQENICSGPGAYTVISCDFRKEEGRSEGHWMIHGQDFHFSRLRSSLLSLETSAKAICDIDVDLSPTIKRTETILQSLLKETERIIARVGEGVQGRSFLVMVTLLWCYESKIDTVCVKGHAFTNGKMPSSNNIQPLKVALAIADKDQNSLVSRMHNIPGAKISSWCRERRTLEQTFKSDEIDEVLLVQAIDNDFLILEGLISNVFVVYKGGILRTAGCGVLEGYARHLIIKYASACGLEVDYQPISLSDSHLWEEILLTSSVKLVVPVDCMYVPIYQQDGNLQGFDKVWSSSGAMGFYKRLSSKLRKD
eukprot:CAMPEP_0194202714 /NCGR_PEP_ID=MMETSP0156-20130528/2669_1 /TAXON_ID=33649 /ORGANISM="Thalassionema nitzschioides, Strain L26-B" /LENGTH=384 /DNA_ID=CAMNT_0038928289 /DNA_START=349 /DNA_END=1506 /DNA_ORIENTATION=-